MRLSAPKPVTFLIGVALGVAAVVLQMLNLSGVSSQIILLLAVLGVAVLAIGSLVRGV
jgi:hypothetical protein